MQEHWLLLMDRQQPDSRLLRDEACRLVRARTEGVSVERIKLHDQLRSLVEDHPEKGVAQLIEAWRREMGAPSRPVSDAELRGVLARLWAEERAAVSGRHEGGQELPAPGPGPEDVAVAAADLEAVLGELAATYPAVAQAVAETVAADLLVTGRRIAEMAHLRRSTVTEALARLRELRDRFSDVAEPLPAARSH